MWKTAAPEEPLTPALPPLESTAGCHHLLDEKHLTQQNEHSDHMDTVSGSNNPDGSNLTPSVPMGGGGQPPDPLS